MGRPGFYEFFCGGGMARAGLGLGWDCLFANDFDEKKGRAYAENWGAQALRVADIHALEARDLPGRPALAWASFPCQDLSLAGAGAGLEGARSGAFWGFCALIEGLARQKRAPAIVALENVPGALTARGGEDFTLICAALQKLGYRFGALTIDAAHFTPQSRPRLFVIGARKGRALPAGLTLRTPCAAFASPALLRAQARLPAPLAADWVWWALPEPPQRNVALADLVEDAPADARWREAGETQALVALMGAPARAKLEAARARPGRQVGALYRRTRPDGAGGRAMRAEARFDGLAGCLRTPGGGSSRQFLLVVEDGVLRSRLMSAREAARLMGLPDDYKLPRRYNEAYHLVGDGVVAPVVRFLAANLLEPLVAGAPPALQAAE